MVQTNPGKSIDHRGRHFSSKTDLIEALIADGLVDSEDDLLRRRPDLVGGLYLDWLQQTPTGCHFATHLALHRSARGDRPPAGWVVRTFVEQRSDEEFAADVASATLDGPNDQIILMIFPWVQTVDDLIELITQVQRCDGWSWEEHPAGVECEDVLVGLRWRLRSDRAVSWALGFAPFDFMPFTRRAPYAAIAMRTLDPPIDEPPDGRQPVHLAQVPHFLGERGRVDGPVWQMTQEWRADLLIGEPEYAAKAKVSFVIPEAFKRRFYDRLREEG